MLRPEELSNIPNTFIELFQELETFVISDFSRRLKKVGDISSTAQWQKERAELFGIRNLEAKISEILKLANNQIESLFPEIALTSIKAENEIYKAAGLKPRDFNKTKEFQDYIKAAIKMTKGDIENITQSLGFAETQNGHVVYNDIAKFYQKEMNIANIKITSGVSDYNTAIKEAVKKFSKSGLRYVDYENGFSNNLDVAVRRAVLSSVHKMTQEISDFNAEKIIPNADERHYEVTAHQGARDTGEGFENHKKWQGKVYKLVGSTAEYPNLAKSTGLGDIQGLKGAGCRHDYYIFIPGASVRTYTDEQLENIDPKPFNYKGKEYNAYEATQHQRKIETAMRQTKRELISYKEAGLEEEFKISSVKLQQQRNEYKQFSKAAELKQKDYRHQVEGFTQSLARQASNAIK
jgi:hypothetical protein